MQTALGLLGVAMFIVGVVALAAAVTFLVVKLTPAKSVKEQREQQQAS